MQWEKNRLSFGCFKIAAKERKHERRKKKELQTKHSAIHVMQENLKKQIV